MLCEKVVMPDSWNSKTPHEEVRAHHSPRRRIFQNATGRSQTVPIWIVAHVGITQDDNPF